MATITGETQIDTKSDDGITAKVPTQTVKIIEKTPSLPSDTTEEEDKTTLSQRKINLIWESTQALIAGMVVLSNMIVGIYQGLVPVNGNDRHEFPTILSSSLFLIVGFYFSRTNHTAVGGVGKKTFDDYRGR